MKTKDYSQIPEEVLKAALEEYGGDNSPKKKKDKDKGSSKQKPEGTKEESSAASEKPQRRIFKRKRAGIVLNRGEVKAIKASRKKLRKEMRARGIKGKREFEMVAASLGLYFDKRNAFLLWLMRHWLPALLGLLALLLLVTFIFAAVTQLRGHFTINMSDKMFREGFTLSDTVDFEFPTTQLFATPAENVPCISVSQLPLDLNEIDSVHNDVYFAYTFYLRNEGESSVNYHWELKLTSESQSLSQATWMMLFVNDEMRIYAAPSAQGGNEALPGFGDNSRGYVNPNIMKLAPGSDQFQTIATRGNLSYYRIIPESFLTDTVIAAGDLTNMSPMDVHKYTVVLWLEGDDPECNDDLIGGNLGVEMQYRLSTEDAEEDAFGGGKSWKEIFEGLRFWE